MPWTMQSALGHTKRATTPAKRKQWASVANSVLKQSGDDAKAIRIANAVIAKSKPKGKRK